MRILSRGTRINSASASQTENIAEWEIKQFFGHKSADTDVGHTLTIFLECEFTLFVVILVLSSTPVLASL